MKENEKKPIINEAFIAWFISVFILIFRTKKRGTQQNVKDARSVLNANARKNNNVLGRKYGTVADARQKLQRKSKMNKVIDARERIQQKHQLQEEVKQPTKARMPKITIYNDEAKTVNPLKFEIKQIVKQNSEMRPISNKNFKKLTGPRNIQSGLRIAVENELARKKQVYKKPVQPKSNLPPIIKSKKFQQMKITTVNKEAFKKLEQMQQPPVVRAPPPTRPVVEAMEIDEAMMSQTYSSPEKVYERPMMSATSYNIGKRIAAVKEQLNVFQSSISTVSPIEGTRLLVTNLHPIVSEDDILELFSVLGAVRRARLIKPGVAEVVYINQDHAHTAYNKYNNRDLDGQPMQIKISASSNSQAHIQPQYSWMSEVKSSRKHGHNDTAEIEPAVLQQALFKGGSTGTSIRPVVFTVKI